MSAALKFAVLLPTLLVAHNLADHIVQTDHQAAHKAHTPATAEPDCAPGCHHRAMAGHVASYTATSAAALAAVTTATGIRPRPAGVLAGLGFSAATHWLIDRRWPVHRVLCATRSPRSAAMTTPLHGPYLADQALHHACLLVAALLMIGRKR